MKFAIFKYSKLDQRYSKSTYGEIHLHDGSTPQSIDNGTTYIKLTGFGDNGLSNSCSPDYTNNKITLLETGVYLVTCSINGSSGTALATFKFAVFLDGVEQDQVHSHRKYTTAGDIGSASLVGTIDVTSANLDLDVRAVHDRPTTVNFTPTYMNLNVSKLGET